MQPIQQQLQQLIADARAMALRSADVYEALHSRLAAKSAVDAGFLNDFAHLLPAQPLHTEQPHTSPPPLPADSWPTQGAPLDHMQRLREALRRDGT